MYIAEYKKISVIYIDTKLIINFKGDYNGA